METVPLNITRKILKLPKNQAKVFVMKTIKNLSTEDISKQLGISTKIVWELIHQARVSLIKDL